MVNVTSEIKRKLHTMQGSRHSRPRASADDVHKRYAVAITNCEASTVERTNV